LLSWRRTNFNVYSLVRAKTNPEAEGNGERESIAYRPVRWDDSPRGFLDIAAQPA
jgi:hypothetical protein